MSLLRRYLLPGFVFQSLVIAGGYGTGRELVEFFLRLGPRAGLLAIVVSTVVWSAVCVVSFEFARRFQAYDYRTFFKKLLGPGWVVFEIGYFGLLMIVLAVIAAAAGSIAAETFGVGYAVGVVLIMVAVGGLVFGGSDAIEKVFTVWSFVLYAVYVVFFFWSLSRFGDQIGSALSTGEVGTEWLIGGVRYAGYNLAVIPAVLFTIRHLETRRETLWAGLLAGPITIIPGLLFFIAMVGHYPDILDRAVPANYLLELLGSRSFQLLFQVMLFGTLIETGAGMIHAVNERLASLYQDRSGEMPTTLRPAVAIGLLLIGTGLSTFGLTDLIARGYGTLTWLFIIVYVVPILTLGVWKLRR